MKQPSNPHAALDERGLIRTLRDLADEMRHDAEVRVALLAAAQQNDRLLARAERAEAQQEGASEWRHIANEAGSALLDAQKWSKWWKRAAKAEREQAHRNKTLLSVCAPPVDELRHRLEVAAHEWSLVKQDDSPLPGMYRRRSDGLLEGEPAEI